MVDLLGGGLRSRALIIKGPQSTQTLTDAGHEFRIYDENGKSVPKGTIEMGTRTFSPNEQGAILIPYGEQETSVPILLVDQDCATVETFLHRRESYSLPAGVLVESQNLLGGSKGRIILRPQLHCNQKLMPLSILEETQLHDYNHGSRRHPKLTCHHPLSSNPIVIQLRSSSSRNVWLRYKLLSQAKVLVSSRDVKENLSTSSTVVVNGVASSAQIADFYLLRDDAGYRLQVRGRNGEPISRLPLHLQFAVDLVTQPVNATLATNEQGEVTLGKVEHVSNLTVSADGMSARTFRLKRDFADWPAQLFVAATDSIRLPWTHDTNEDSKHRDWTLLEVRNQLVVALA